MLKTLNLMNPHLEQEVFICNPITLSLNYSLSLNYFDIICTGFHTKLMTFDCEDKIPDN